MVVLSTGFRIDDDVRETGPAAGCGLKSPRVRKDLKLRPGGHLRPGVYVCGMFESPKDIPETMVQASAAACRAAGHVATDESEEAVDDHFRLSGTCREKRPGSGIFICDCGENIGGVVDVRSTGPVGRRSARCCSVRGGGPRLQPGIHGAYSRQPWPKATSTGW